MELIAHRGFALCNPENTIRAIRAAAPIADEIEVDVRRCGSGELVLHHDERVDRTTDGTGRVADLSLAELRTLSVQGSDEPVPAVAAAVEAIPTDVRLNLELKEPDTAGDALAAVADADCEIVFSSSHPAPLREAAGEVSLAYVYGPDEAGGDAAPVETATDLGCDALNACYGLCFGESDLVGRARGAGLAVNAWTVRTEEMASRLATAGVGGVIADRPDVL